MNELVRYTRVRRWQRRGLTALAVVGGLVWSASPAKAAVSDIGAAAVSNATQYATSATANASAPNITCDPSANGAAVVQDTNVVVGAIFAEDAAVGRAECISLQSGASYSISVWTVMEYYDFGTNAWYSTGCQTAPRVFRSSAGVAASAPPLSLLCTYNPFTQGNLLNRYHRAHTYVSESLFAQTFDQVSPSFWYMNP
jgi:hypothetical protein